MPESPETTASRSPSWLRPSGLTCASELWPRRGYEVSFLRPCTPQARAGLWYPRVPSSKAIVANEVKKLEPWACMLTDMVIGKVLSIDDLFEEMGFKAVFVGSAQAAHVHAH